MKRMTPAILALMTAASLASPPEDPRAGEPTPQPKQPLRCTYCPRFFKTMSGAIAHEANYHGIK